LNYNKIQADILKARLEEILKDKKGLKIPYKRVMKDVWISMDGAVLYRIPERFLIIDIEKLDRPPMDGITNIIEESEEYRDCKPTGITMKKENLDCVVYELDGEQIYINKKLMANFDKDCVIRSKGWQYPHHVYENGLFVGVVCGVRP
jgi:hypothetical protein